MLETRSTGIAVINKALPHALLVFFQSNTVKHNLLRVRMACIVYIYMYLTLPKRLLELRRYLCWET